MRKTCCSVLVVVMTLSLAVLGAAKAAASPISASSVAGEQPGRGQSQMSSETLSPEAQQKLIKKIQSALLKLPYLGVFDNIAFLLQGRTVTLIGSVTSEHSQTKQDAERAVKKIEGVDKVVNNIEVLPPGPLDDRLRREVYNAIYSYGPLFKYSTDKVNPPIRIIVSGGHVTLEGVVNNETDKNLCTMRANQVPGVIGTVTNNLRVVKG
ncbi:MAG TPA: BON domain-containing protein [Candidatus Bathyarchaeia archaeon]|nr:BON domain-containing protein [Candidatus Bathyarchaeia archaeon]